MLHLPSQVTKPVPAVLILHGFTGQRLEPHRLFVLFSRLLAQRGIASMRVDFRGSGESEGTFDEMTPSREVEDVVAAYQVLRDRPEVDGSRLGLLGLSMGGMVAALSVAQPGLDFASLALWAPAHPKVWLGPIPEDASGEHVWAAYRESASKPGATIGFDETTDRMDFFGNPVSRAFFHDLLALDSFQTVTAHRGPALVVHGTADPTVPISVGQTYAEVLETRGESAGETTFHAIPDALHTFETLSSQREAHRVTLEFFEKTLLG
jgi:dipeptidyl aminopeptidase/acylaminoacyl peptidase